MNSSHVHGWRSSTAPGVPLTQDWPVMFAFSSQSPSSHSARGYTILVAEANETTNRTLCELLDSYGYKVQRASSGSDALENLTRHLVDLVITNSAMPDMDTYEFLNQMHDIPHARLVPVVLLTADSSPEQRGRAREAGIIDYIVKSSDQDELYREELLQTVRLALKRYAEQQAALNQRIEEVRNQILGLVQHEFRTPLTFVMGYAEFLQEGLRQGLPYEELQHSIEAILEGSSRLHHLVESFLLLANLSRETLPNDEIYPLDPTALWRECIAGVRETLEDAEITVRLAEPPDPIIVFGVMDLLREALSRLLDNAIRYRRDDTHTIWLATVARPGYVGWLIRDEGMGIPASLRAELAAPFVRLHERKANGHGIGLGLTLVRRVAELHGGFLEIESQEGVGSTFTLWVSDREEI